MALAGENDFETCRQEADEWLKSFQPSSSSSGWSLLLADETDRQLVFNHTNGVSFKVFCQFAENKTFKVQSDQREANALLKGYCGSNIQDCLGKCTTALQSLIGQSDRKSDDHHDDDDDADDDDADADDYDDDDGYYDNPSDGMDLDDEVKSSDMIRKQSSTHSSEQHDDADFRRYSKSGSHTAVHRLISDLKMFNKSDGQFGIRGGPRGDHLFLWDVQFIDFDSKSQLCKDLVKYSERYEQKPEVQLEVTFPDDYPMSPPFIRIIRPRFKFLTGHVTIGGSVCLQLLTKSGWRPINDIESILVQVRSAIISDANARLDMAEANRKYMESEARTAFQRMVERYNW